MKLKDIGITPLIEMTSGGSTSAGSIAGVASSIFTPTSDGTIRRTKKKKKKDESIAGDAGAPVGRKLGESLTRQHFEMFADVLRDVADPDKRQEHADFLIQVFTMDNPRFDISRFLKASGLTERKLSGTKKKNKEHNVKKLKKHKDNFAKYGNDAESVMYAVATKSAKKGKKYS